jgi:hypothetical protein
VNGDVDPNRIVLRPVEMHRLVISQKYKLNNSLSTVCPSPKDAFETSLGKKIMNIKIGDKIRYIATSEDGEVVGASELAPGCVLGRPLNT